MIFIQSLLTRLIVIFFFYLASTEKIKLTSKGRSRYQVLYHHLQRLELMVEYATQSITLMLLTTEGNNDEANQVANNIKKSMNEKSATEIFIAH